MSLSTDRTVYEVSLLEYSDISSTTVMRKYKVTDKYAKMIALASAKLKHDREHGIGWHLFESECPPCFKEILISDGEIVCSAICNDVCNVSAKFIQNAVWHNYNIKEFIWWKLPPKGPREEYGIS